LLALLAGFAHAEVAVPPLTGRVVDLTGTLSGATVANVESKLKALEDAKGAQLAVLIVPTVQPEEIEQFGIRVEDAWKLGRKGVDDGAYLIIAKDDHRVRIEVGRGLEGALTDATSNRIIEEAITPRFKSGDYDGGIEAGIDKMIAVVNGEPLPAPDHRWERSTGNLGSLLPILLIGVFVASGILRSIFGRLFGAVVTGGLGGMIVWFLTHLLAIGFGAGLFAFVFALLSGATGRGWTSGGGWGGYGGGFGGGGFGGGGGGGGFSGGGGGGAGGGASGSW
jgi:uncharacterized protein